MSHAKQLLLVCMVSFPNLVQMFGNETNYTHAHEENFYFSELFIEEDYIVIMLC